MFFFATIATAAPLRLWIEARDSSGKHTSGLTAADLKILKDGKEQQTSCFEEIQLSPSGTPQKRKLVIAVDAFNTSKLEYVAIRDQLVEFVSNLDPSRWSVMLLGLTPGTPTVSVPFTEDMEQLTNELETMQANNSRDKDIATKKREITDQVDLDSSKSGRARAARLAAAYAIEEMQQVRLTLQGISLIGRYADRDATGEHIAVLLISGGLNVRPGRQYLDLLSRINAGGFSEELERQAAVNDVKDEIKKKIGLLNRSNITIYTLFVHGSGIPENIEQKNQRFITNDASLLGDLRDGLTQVAAETGGIAYHGSGDFEKATAGLINDEQSGYQLCINSDAEKKEKYHSIEIKTNKPGISLRYRKGFISEEM